MNVAMKEWLMLLIQNGFKPIFLLRFNDVGIEAL